MPWRTMHMRGARVFARCDERGALVADKGRVEIRYKAGVSKPYHASLGNLMPTTGAPEVFPEDHCSAGDGAAPPAETAKKKKGAKPSNRNQVATMGMHDASPPIAPEAGEILVYADGACSGNPGPAGLGVVMLWENHRKDLSEYIGHGTNNVAELLAIQRACEAVEDVSTPVRIYTDSSYCIGVVTKKWKPKANKELVADVRRAVARLSDVALIHVRGHAGVQWNERADELARQAVESRGTAGWVTVT